MLTTSSGVHSEAQKTDSGTSWAWLFNARPCRVRVMITWRSSLAARVRVTNPADSSRFSSGVNVVESRNRRAPISETINSSRSHSTIITRYCGYVRPSLRSSLRYTLFIASIVEYSAKHSCSPRSSEGLGLRGRLARCGVVMHAYYIARYLIARYSRAAGPVCAQAAGVCALAGRPQRHPLFFEI